MSVKSNDGMQRVVPYSPMAILGKGNDGAYKNDFGEWDQATNIWTVKAPVEHRCAVNPDGRECALNH